MSHEHCCCHNTPSNKEINEEEQDATYDHVIERTSLFGGIQGLNMLINICRNKITAVVLGPQGSGIIAILSNLIELVHHSTDLGLCFSSVKHISEIFATGDKAKIESFVRTVRLWCFGAGLLGLLVAAILAFFTSFTETTISNVMIIAPAIAMLTIIAGEQAILKGTKQIKKVAIISVLGTLATFIICSIFYYTLKFQGIALALLANNAALLLINLHYSTKTYPYRFSEVFSRFKENFNAGTPMVILGISYVIAGIFGTGAEYVIRHFILQSCADEEVGEIQLGLYASGYAIVVTYAALVFKAIDIDFFPRLSASANNAKLANRIINQQIEVCALLMAPLLTGLVLFMPHLVHILYTNNYHSAIPMAVTASLFMFFKAFFTPVEYLALAKGDSKMYMGVELCYDILIAIIIPLGYHYFGLIGCGVALSIAGILNTIFVFSIYSWKYHFRFKRRLLAFYIVQFILITLTIASVMYSVIYEVGTYKWTIGPVCLLISLFISGRILYKDTTILQKIYNKICHKFRS